jgi:hypothetical protein
MRWSLRGRPRAQWAWMGLFILAVLTSAVPAFAQFERGQISGVVKDEQGGVMPGVTVTATNKGTGTPSSVTTDATGFYTLPNLQPGRYDITAELQGFKKIVRNDLQLDAAGQMRYDVTMTTGALTEEVTVTAEAAPLQTDVAMRKTVEAKDIEQLAFAGRNPMGVIGLKAGVSGGGFISTRGFSDLGNGGYNINGSRSDENNITVDGATSIRTRASGNTIGVLDVDAVQEVQVLTANYMPEFGRASGGQMRFVTKSGSNRFSGSASYFYRNETLQANTFTRNKSPNALENSGAAPFDYKQYGYALGGPLFKDKLFFFGAQEWVNFSQVQTVSVTVPSALMRQGNFSELLNASNPFFGSVKTIIDPQTGQPFPGNIIPAGRLSANGLAILNAYPAPTPGYQNGANNALVSSPNPQDQRKDNLRFDYRLNNSNQFTFRLSKYDWKAVDAFRGNLPFARTSWDRPNTTLTTSWTSTLSNNLINEANFTYSHDYVYINLYTADGVYQRSRYGINYPYIFPGGQKEIEDKVPTVNLPGFQQIDGGPYPSHSDGPIYTWSDSLTYVKGRHTFKAGVSVEYSGENDFDQINVNATPGGTNNQNGAFTFADNTSGGVGLAVANVAYGIYSNYAELGQRNFTQWRALATDTFIQDSWKPTSQLTIEGGIRWVFWPPWYSNTNNIANFEPQAYSASGAAVINPATGLIVSGPRYNGVVLPGTGFLGDAASSALASNPAVTALFIGAPRGFSQTHYNVIEPRGGMTYAINEKTILRTSAGIFHNRVTLNDSTLLGGNPPFQPQVTLANGSVDNPGGGTAAAGSAPFTITSQDLAFNHPTSYMWAGGVQRELPLQLTVDVSYVGRAGAHLQRERNINQLQQGALQANPGINIAALRPYLGYGAIRLSENAGHSIYNSLQVSADRRYRNGLKIGVAYTFAKSQDNASDKRTVVWNTYDDTNFYGPSDYDRRHVLNFYYIYDLPFFRAQDTLMKNILGGWQISGATFYRTGTPNSIQQTATDVAGVGDQSIGQPWNVVGDINSGVNNTFSNGAAVDNNFFFNPKAFAAPATGTFGNSTRNLFYNPGQNEWDIAIFKNFRTKGTSFVQFRAEVFNLFNHPNLSAINRDPTNQNTFGRITGKDDARRDIQLSLRFQF